MTGSDGGRPDAESDAQIDLFDRVGWEQGAVERWARTAGYELVIGIDEAGRGPLAGPVVTAACVLDLERAAGEGWLERVTDSKLLSRAERDDLFESIRGSAIACAVDQAEPYAIDDLNIHQATMRSMRRAVEPVARAVAGRRALIAVDGHRRVPGLRSQRAFVRGDQRSRHIAAASILAKVTRDRILERYHERWPEYGFDVHKGYPTEPHRRALLERGPCPVHRRSFTGCGDGQAVDDGQLWLGV